MRARTYRCSPGHEQVASLALVPPVVEPEPYSADAWLRCARWGTELPAYRAMIHGDPCAYCGESGGTADHIEPKRGRNGKGPAEHLTGCCDRCNGEKGAMSLLRFLLSIPGSR